MDGSDAYADAGPTEPGMPAGITSVQISAKLSCAHLPFPASAATASGAPLVTIAVCLTEEADSKELAIAATTEPFDRSQVIALSAKTAPVPAGKTVDAAALDRNPPFTSPLSLMYYQPLDDRALSPEEEAFLTHRNTVVLRIYHLPDIDLSDESASVTLQDEHIIGAAIIDLATVLESAAGSDFADPVPVPLFLSVPSETPGGAAPDAPPHGVTAKPLVEAATQQRATASLVFKVDGTAFEQDELPPGTVLPLKDENEAQHEAQPEAQPEAQHEDAQPEVKPEPEAAPAAAAAAAAAAVAAPAAPSKPAPAKPAPTKAAPTKAAPARPPPAAAAAVAVAEAATAAAESAAAAAAVVEPAATLAEHASEHEAKGEANTENNNSEKHNDSHKTEPAAAEPAAAAAVADSTHEHHDTHEQPKTDTVGAFMASAEPVEDHRDKSAHDHGGHKAKDEVKDESAGAKDAPAAATHYNAHDNAPLPAPSPVNAPAADEKAAATAPSSPASAKADAAGAAAPATPPPRQPSAAPSNASANVHASAGAGVGAGAGAGASRSVAGSTPASAAASPAQSQRRALAPSASTASTNNNNNPAASAGSPPPASNNGGGNAAKPPRAPANSGTPQPSNANTNATASAESVGSPNKSRRASMTAAPMPVPASPAPSHGSVAGKATPKAPAQPQSQPQGQQQPGLTSSASTSRLTPAPSASAVANASADGGAGTGRRGSAALPTPGSSASAAAAAPARSRPPSARPVSAQRYSAGSGGAHGAGTPQPHGKGPARPGSRLAMQGAHSSSQQQLLTPQQQQLHDDAASSSSDTPASPGMRPVAQPQQTASYGRASSPSPLTESNVWREKVTVLMTQKVELERTLDDTKSLLQAKTDAAHDTENALAAARAELAAMHAQLEMTRAERDDCHRELSEARQTIRHLQSRDAQLTETTEAAVRNADIAESSSATSSRQLYLMHRLARHLTTVAFVKMFSAKRALLRLMCGLYSRAQFLLSEVTADPAPPELTSSLLSVAARSAASPALPDLYELLSDEVRAPESLMHWDRADSRATGTRTSSANPHSRAHAASAGAGTQSNSSTTAVSGAGAGGVLSPDQFKFRLASVPMDALLATVETLSEALGEAVDATVLQKRHWYRATHAFSQRSVELAGTAKNALLMQHLHAAGTGPAGGQSALSAAPGAAAAAAAAAENEAREREQAQQQQQSQLRAAAAAAERDRATIATLEERLEHKKLQTQAYQRQYRVAQDLLTASAARATDLAGYVDTLQRCYVRTVSTLGGATALGEFPLPPPPLTPVVDSTQMGSGSPALGMTSGSMGPRQQEGGAVPSTLPPIRNGGGPQQQYQQQPPAVGYAGGSPDLYSSMSASQRGEQWRTPRETTLQRQGASDRHAAYGDAAVAQHGGSGRQPQQQGGGKAAQVERDYGGDCSGPQQQHPQQQQGQGQRVRVRAKGVQPAAQQGRSPQQGQGQPSAAKMAHLARLSTFLATQERSLFSK